MAEEVPPQDLRPNDYLTPDLRRPPQHQAYKTPEVYRKSPEYFPQAAPVPPSPYQNHLNTPNKVRVPEKNFLIDKDYYDKMQERERKRGPVTPII